MAPHVAEHVRDAGLVISRIEMAAARATSEGNSIMTLIDPRTMANAIRFLSIDAIERVGGHPGTRWARRIPWPPCSRVTSSSTQDPLWFDRDRFVQSSGHGSMLYVPPSPERIREDHHRRDQALRRTRIPLRGHPRVRSDLRDRDHHRTSRPGHRQRGGHGACRVLPEQVAGTRYRRSLHLCPRRGRLPSGGVVRRSYRSSGTCGSASSCSSGTTTG